MWFKNVLGFKKILKKYFFYSVNLRILKIKKNILVCFQTKNIFKKHYAPQ
jgi:ABC-type uncharacterized transport system permease subunit